MKKFNSIALAALFAALPMTPSFAMADLNPLSDALPTTSTVNSALVPLTTAQLEEQQQAFLYACMIGDTEKVKTLFSTVPGIDVNKSDSNGWTPLHRACENAHLDIIELLLKTDDIEATLADNNGNTPLDIVQEELLILGGVQRYNDIATLLRKHIISKLLDRRVLRQSLVSMMHEDCSRSEGVLDLENPINLTLPNEYLISIIASYISPVYV